MREFDSHVALKLLQSKESHAKGAFMSDKEWILDELHKLRKFADNQNMELSVEALRVAIVQVAFELEAPTGLRVRDLTLGKELNFGDKTFH